MKTNAFTTSSHISEQRSGLDEVAKKRSLVPSTGMQMNVRSMFMCQTIYVIYVRRSNSIHVHIPEEEHLKQVGCFQSLIQSYESRHIELQTFTLIHY